MALYVLVKTKWCGSSSGYEVTGVEAFVDAAKAIKRHNECGGIVYDVTEPSWDDDEIAEQQRQLFTRSEALSGAHFEGRSFTELDENVLQAAKASWLSDFGLPRHSDAYVHLCNLVSMPVRRGI